jgi:hypothetical protein
MNIFSGSRRIATVAGALWVIGWLIAAVSHETKVYARYDFVVGSNFANFAGFDLYSCPQKTNSRSLEIKTESGQPVQVTLCISGSSINVPEGFILEPFDPDVYLAKKQIESENGLTPNTIKVFFADGTSHTYANSNDEITADKLLQRAKKDFPNKEVAKIIGKGVHWIDYEALAKIFGGEVVVEEKKKIALANALARLQEKANTGSNEPQGNPFDIFDERKVHSAFKIRKEDEARLNAKWWETWRSAYGQGLAAMLGGLIALWIFTLAMGWIVRGFLGIPRGMDSKMS